MIRKTASLVILFSFILLAISSAVLYISPEGRVAYWGDWTFWGITKDRWGAIHYNLGFVFVIFSIIHIFLNIKPIFSYIVNSKKTIGKAPIPLMIALILNIGIFLGSVYSVQPIKQISTWNADLKAYQAKVNGKPPYGHAELSSLEELCSFLGADVDSIIQKLQSKNFKGDITKKSTILDISRANNTTPKTVFEALDIKMTKSKDSKKE